MKRTFFYRRGLTARVVRISSFYHGTSKNQLVFGALSISLPLSLSHLISFCVAVPVSEAETACKRGGLSLIIYLTD